MRLVHASPKRLSERFAPFIPCGTHEMIHELYSIHPATGARVLVKIHDNPPVRAQVVEHYRDPHGVHRMLVAGKGPSCFRRAAGTGVDNGVVGYPIEVFVGVT